MVEGPIRDRQMGLRRHPNEGELLSAAVKYLIISGLTTF